MKEKKALEEWQIEDAKTLRRLFDARTELVDGKLITQTDFGANYGIGSQGMVWQYLNGHRPLNIKAAAAFARGLGVSVAEISPTLATQAEEASAIGKPDLAVAADEQTSPQTLQWISALEAELLNYFRAADKIAQGEILVFARTLGVESDIPLNRDNS